MEQKVNRWNFFPSFNVAKMAVTDIQFDCQLLLRHAVDLAQVLDTFVGGEPSFGCRGSVGTQSIFFSCFFVLSLSVMARRAEYEGRTECPS